MALPSTLVWDINGPAGLDTNGGAYNPAVTSPGTDYTYPTSAPISYTDLSAPTVTTLTSVNRPFIVADNGNTVKTTTNGYFAITSVSGGTATGVWSGTAPTAGTTGISGALGGALATPWAAIAVMVASNLCWIRDKGSFYTTSVSTAFVAAGVTPGGTTNYTRIFGYGTVRGDAGRASLKIAAQVSAISGAPNGTHLANLVFDGGTSFTFSNGVSGSSYLLLENCKFQNMASSSSGISTQLNGLRVRNCEFTSIASGGAGISIGNSAGGAIVEECHFHDMVGSALAGGAVSSLNTLRRNLFKNCGGTWGNWKTLNAEGNTFYACAPLILSAPNIALGGFVRNNIFAASTGAGLDTDAALASDLSGLANGNAYYNNAGGVRGANIGATGGDTADIILTADPFVNASGNDFRLNNNAGGGALLRGNGLPQNLPGLPSAANAPDMGAYQHATPALGLTVSASGTNPVLTWDADPRVVTGYVVLRGATVAALAEIATVGSGTTTYTDTSVSSGTYVYSVASY